SNSQLNEKGFVDSRCSRHMSGNIAHLSDFKEFDGGYVTFGGGANGGRITGKGFDNDQLVVAIVLKDKQHESLVVAGIFLIFLRYQEGSESNISSQKDQDCIFMPIWKDASYFEDITPQSVDDVQLQDQDKNHCIASFQDDVIDDHQLNSNFLKNRRPNPTTEDSQEENQGIDWGIYTILCSFFTPQQEITRSTN
ncbi:hypothetical protein Tco_0289515, partial [Tanacetum coccineum]